MTVTDVEDETPPEAPTIALQNDTGSDGSDKITNDATITVTGVEESATVEVSTDSGTSWTEVTTTDETDGSKSFDGVPFILFGSLCS